MTAAEKLSLRLAGIELAEAMNEVVAVTNALHQIEEVLLVADPLMAGALGRRADRLAAAMRKIDTDVLPPMRRLCK